MQKYTGFKFLFCWQKRLGEKGLTDPNRWLTIKDFASKAAENAARLAALFHLFEGKDGAIDSEMVDRAVQVITWHLWETKRLLNANVKSIPNQQQDAMRLVRWLKIKGLNQTTQRYLQQFCPIRDKQQRNSVIQNLIATNYLKEIKLNGKMAILVNPAVKEGL
jgi:isopentenyldiphosphate isomerase